MEDQEKIYCFDVEDSIRHVFWCLDLAKFIENLRELERQRFFAPEQMTSLRKTSSQNAIESICLIPLFLLFFCVFLYILWFLVCWPCRRVYRCESWANLYFVHLDILHKVVTFILKPLA